MIFYRLCEMKFADSAFSGFGAEQYGGRWNNKDIKCVYLSESKSLCILETVVHLDTQTVLSEYAMLSIEVPDDEIMRLEENDLPDNWRSYPAPKELADLGSDWIDSKQSLVLLVPSAISGDWCALLNPNHPKSNEFVTQAQRMAFGLDSRLVKGR
ncbi:RES family NAD+ phosphorylase [Marinomonas sp. 2405UD68-3]|uniref:RES family NAD+ phosphorylase n=1 Tax=Marinomonas sp. 2405UD68-3 TaxID=3391835 RepID=UPI0039C95236